MTELASKEDLVSVTIDGFEISVPKGTLLIRAAEQLGIQIPRFCDHPLLDPADVFGGEPSPLTARGYTPEEIRERLHARAAEAETAAP